MPEKSVAAQTSGEGKKMFSFFKKKKKQSIETLFFKSNEAAFEHACNFMDCTIRVGGYLPALVHEVQDSEDRTRMILKLPNTDGGQYVASSLLNNQLKNIKAGDLVVYQLAERLPNVPDVLSMIGFVVAKLKPQLDVKHGWVLEE